MPPFTVAMVATAEAVAAAEALAIAEATAAAAAAAETAAATAAAESAVAETAATNAGINEIGAQEVAKQTAQQGIMQASAGADVNAGLSQGIVGATPPSPGAPLPPATPLTPAGASPPPANVPIDIDPFGGFPSSGPTPPPASTESAANVINQGMQQPPNPFMQAYEYVDKMHPLSKGLGAYGLLSASGALRQEGASPPGQKTFNNPYHFSPNFKGTHPNPNDYQYAPKYPSYAMGGITGLPPQTNFANPSQSMMGTSQYDMPTDPMNGNIANRMAEGGVTGSGQMQLNVPINVGGGGGGGLGGASGSPYTPAGGGGGGYTPPGGPQGHPPGGFDRLGVDKLGGPQGGGSGLGSLADILRGRQDNPLVGPQPMPYGGFNSLQEHQQALRRQAEENNKGELGYPQQPTAQLLGPTQSPFAGGSDSTNSTTSADMGYKGPIQRGLGGKGGFSQQPTDNTGKGIGFAKGGSTTDIYDASLRFADMLDNPSRYTPPDTRFQSVDTFRDTNPNTANKLADEAAETRRKAIEQRSYVNTGAKFPTVSRRPGQLDLGPVGGERGKYDNQESILAAQGGIMGYNLGGYANGGNPRLLRGPGDGMSDNIPATISDRQPARLADGEFVIPADVVSHLGNGSTEAGAKKLHEMMNSVRRARTGNPKQGKKINPNKFMPKK